MSNTPFFYRSVSTFGLAVALWAFVPLAVHAQGMPPQAVPAAANPIPMMAAPGDTAPTDPAAAPAAAPVATADAPAPVPAPQNTAPAAPVVPAATEVPAAQAPAPSDAALKASNSGAVPSLMESIGGAVANGGEQATEFPGMNLPIGEQPAGAQQQVKTAEEDQAEMRKEAYEAMMSGLLPLQPDELREAFVRVDKNQKAIEEPLSYPKPEVAFTTISLDPGATPLTFKLATGHVTTVTFLDVTGAPWPIKDVSWAGNFEIKAPTDGNATSSSEKDKPTDAAEEEKKRKEVLSSIPNVMRIIPLAEYAHGNMSIRLAGLTTPVTFTLRTNKEVVQYRLDIRIPEMGPLATPPLIQNGDQGMTAGDTTLTQVMEGIPPADAEKLSVSGVDGRTSVYRVAGVVYVRTPLTLLSPSWTGSVKSADGMNVYAIGNAPVLLLSDEGQMVRAKISETDDGESK